MSKTIRYLLFAILGAIFLMPSAQAQFVNFEDTWQEFLRKPKTANISKLVKPNKNDEPKYYLQYCLMYANTHFCAGDIPDAGRMMKEIREMGEEQYSEIPSFKDKYEKIKGDMEAHQALSQVWIRFLEDRDVTVEELEKEEYSRAKSVCEKGTLAKYFHMTAADYYCEAEVSKSRDHFQNRVLKLVENTSLKATDVQGLDAEVKKYKKIFATLPKIDKAWKEYFETGKSPGFKDDMAVVECYSIPNMKIFVLRAAVDVCKYGPENWKKIEKLLKTNTHAIPDDLNEKIEWLKGEIGNSEQDLVDLDEAWKKYIAKHTTKTWKEGFPEEDTVLGEEIKLADFYCDKIAQTKSWVIKGGLNACAEGQAYIDKIDKLKKEHKLEYNKDLACQVSRLKGKVYQCRYWELVLQARKETHEERERFGPLAAEVMYEDLNGPELPCETTVDYEPLGFIGVKYIIKVFLCQKINLAKMGDPEFFKKISTWVDSKVLQEYCETDMRCKEDFFIYLEGHTDGHAFNGRKYDQKIGIPMGTDYAHYTDVDTVQKKTDHEITDRLQNNMELGLARAWTVKQQLDFMKVPITIGAYEHPEEEKGGEFRQIQIHLNITNLLLDFYEKRLKELIEKSGIGKRPAPC